MRNPIVTFADLVEALEEEGAGPWLQKIKANLPSPEQWDYTLTLAIEREAFLFFINRLTPIISEEAHTALMSKREGDYDAALEILAKGHLLFFTISDLARQAGIPLQHEEIAIVFGSAEESVAYRSERVLRGF